MPVEHIYSDFTSYDLIDTTKNEEILKELCNMKFDVIVGNPPYQETMAGTSDNPIYNLFYDNAFELCNKVSLITPARYLFKAGKTPKDWNEKMLNDEHFRGRMQVGMHPVITDFPETACVEVPCLVDGMGVHPTHVGSLPPVLAAMNMTNINTQLLTIEAARTRKKEDILRAVMLEPRCAAILSIDDMAKMVDELLQAHGPYMAMYR